MSEFSARHVTCSKCAAPWEVIEVPIGSCHWRVEARLYVCPDCRKPANGQLELDRGNLDELPYSPSMVRLEF